MIIDGDRVGLTSTSINSFETNYELKVYDLPVDIFSKICKYNDWKPTWYLIMQNILDLSIKLLCSTLFRLLLLF
jgi:hypothetical protein